MKSPSDRFVKLYQSIFDSSIAENYELRHFFEDMLKLADFNTGIVDMTPQAISRRINLPLDKVLEFIPLLMADDPQDKSGVAHGRRIELLDAHRDWGWQIINYGTYKAMRCAEERREYNRMKQQEWRAKQREEKLNGISTPRKKRPLMPTQFEARPRLANGTMNEEGFPTRKPKVLTPDVLRDLDRDAIAQAAREQVSVAGPNGSIAPVAPVSPAAAPASIPANPEPRGPGGILMANLGGAS